MRKKFLAIGVAMSLAVLAVIVGTAGAAVAPGLTYTGPAAGSTGTIATYTASLANDSGAPVSGATVTFKLDNQPAATATTGANGIAVAPQEILKAAGSYLLVVSSEGQSDAAVRFNVNPPATNVLDVRAAAGGGEPSIATGPDGSIYTSGLSNGTTFLRSTDGGASWQKPAGLPFSSSGDSTVGVDSSGSVYLTDLSGGAGLADTLQVMLYKSRTAGNAPWAKGLGPAGATQAGSNASNSPMLVDRQWVDAYIPPNGSTDTAKVYMTYHDWAPSQIWVNSSTDGGAHFGVPVDVITSPQASAASFCDTIPGGIKVVKSGPHAGRVYVAWLAGDVVFNPATGCNETQAQLFHTVWVAWSDNADAQVPTWTDQLVYDAGIGKDASTIFADIDLDTAGNPYIAFSMPTLGEWDTFVMASFDNGATWNGKSDGTGVPYTVNADTGSHYFPAIAAGDPGRVDVVYLRSPGLVPVLPDGKPKPGGDPNMLWSIYVAQSLDLNLGSPTWTITDVKAKPMHKGDICTFGIACLGNLGADRSLADFIDIAITPDGRFHASYTDNYLNAKELDVVNQTSGPSAYAPK
jgi:hypothetical protein